MVPTGKMIPDPQGTLDDTTKQVRMIPQTRPLYRKKRSMRVLLALLGALDQARFSTKKVEHSGTVNVNLAERLTAARKRVARDRAGADTGRGSS